MKYKFKDRFKDSVKDRVKDKVIHRDKYKGFSKEIKECNPYHRDKNDQKTTMPNNSLIYNYNLLIMIMVPHCLVNKDQIRKL